MLGFSWICLHGLRLGGLERKRLYVVHPSVNDPDQIRQGLATMGNGWNNGTNFRFVGPIF